MISKPSMTLDRVLSRFGLASRGEALAAIERGRLKVNGRVIRDPGFWVRPDEDAIQLDGLRMKRAPAIYLLFYKPKGVITSHGDPGGRKTVYDFFGEIARWVAPAGRLDRDSSGLLIMTNDTDFASRVTSPASHVTKTYLVKTSGLMPDETVAALAAGVRMKRGDWARPLSVRRREDRGKYTWLDVTLTEGKNREVRRMTEAVGFKVLKLVRTAIGPLALKGLEAGKWRRLTPAEVKTLRRLASEQRTPFQGS